MFRVQTGAYSLSLRITLLPLSSLSFSLSCCRLWVSWCRRRRRCCCLSGSRSSFACSQSAGLPFLLIFFHFFARQFVCVYGILINCLICLAACLFAPLLLLLLSSSFLVPCYNMVAAASASALFLSFLFLPVSCQQPNEYQSLVVVISVCLTGHSQGTKCALALLYFTFLWWSLCWIGCTLCTHKQHSFCLLLVEVAVCSGSSSSNISKSRKKL